MLHENGCGLINVLFMSTLAREWRDHFMNIYVHSYLIEHLHFHTPETGSVGSDANGKGYIQVPFMVIDSSLLSVYCNL